jgi:hypothetical protein
VQVAFHRSESDFAGGLYIGLFEVGLQLCQPRFHRPRRHEHFRYIAFALFEETPDLGHGGEHALVQDRPGGHAGLKGMIDVFSDRILIPVYNALKDLLYDFIHRDSFSLTNDAKEVFEVAVDVNRHRHLMR